MKCHHCGKEGHLKKNCYHFNRINKNKADNNKKENNNKDKNQAQLATSTPGFAFMMKKIINNNKTNDERGFILDSGATDHLINDESLFVDYVVLEQPI